MSDNLALGTDVNWTGDLDPMFSLVGGRLALAQAIARRLSTPTGALAQIGDDPDYGFDVKAYCNETVTPSVTSDVQAHVTAQCLQDERVQDAACTVTATPTGAGTILTITVTLTDAIGPFLLVLSVSAVTVAILQVQS